MTGMLASMRWTLLLIATGCAGFDPKDDPDLLSYSEGLCTEAGVANLNINISDSETAMLVTIGGDDLIALDEMTFKHHAHQ